MARHWLFRRHAFVLATFCLGLATPARADGPTQRQFTQHMLRRFSFSASPQDVTAVLNEGTAAWLAQQLNWQAIDDSGSEMEQLPTQLDEQGGYPDYQVFERYLMQHLVLTRRQLQAKLELHWLDHFAISLNGVSDPALLSHYDATVRANALGNFGTLLAAVGAEPAMLDWLDNNFNFGDTPNENFAREVMQLYSTGAVELNQDGSQVLDQNNLPVPNYSQRDVQEIARAMTGYIVYYNDADPDPETRFSVQYYADHHYTGKLKFLGKQRPVPNDGTAIAYVANVLAHEPSTGPYEVTEMLKRFVTETPSAQFISDIVKVWNANVDAPDQIAQVVSAIISHPDFAASYHSMPKQPAEMLVGAMRQLPGMMEATQATGPGESLLWELSGLGQELYYPPTVFSFYTPGHVETEINTASILYRTKVMAIMVNADRNPQSVDTWIDMPTLRSLIGNTNRNAIADYLLDALVDGGTPRLREVLLHFLGDTPDDEQVKGAMWLLLNTPDYTVN